MARIFQLPKQVPIVGGAVSPGAKANFYLTGTTTPTDTYTDSALATPHSNPVVADAAGVFEPIYLDPDITYKVTITDTDDVLIYTEDPIIDSLTQANIGKALYPRTAAEISAGVTPTNYQYEPGNVLRYGAGPNESEATNKSALQSAISVADAAGDGFAVVVPFDAPYGYESTDSSTHPDFSSVSSDILVIDYTPGSTYTSPAKDGMQVRYFYHTEQTATPGQHDGNGQRILSDWHPYLWLDNHGGGPQSPRTANDNRRATLFFARDGVAAWGFGMGSLQSSTATDDELSNLRLVSFDGPDGQYTALAISLITGNWLFNTDSNTESASYHFKQRTDGYIEMLVESIDEDCRFILRNDAGSSEDIELRNVSGEYQLVVAGVGAAQTIDRSRNVKVGAGAVATDATDGFLYVPTCAGTPTGTPTTKTGNAPIVVDTTNHKLYFYSGGSWRDAGP